MRTDAQQGILLNIVVGIVGAFLGGLIFNRRRRSTTAARRLTRSWSSLVGAIILLAIVNLFRAAASASDASGR